MTTFDKFKLSWEKNFPDEPVIPQNLAFFANPKDPVVLEKCIDSCIGIREKLQRELNKQDFILQFIFQLMDEAGVIDDRRSSILLSDGSKLRATSGEGVVLSDAEYVLFGKLPQSVACSSGEAAASIDENTVNKAVNGNIVHNTDSTPAIGIVNVTTIVADSGNNILSSAIGLAVDECSVHENSPTGNADITEDVNKIRKVPSRVRPSSVRVVSNSLRQDPGLLKPKAQSIEDTCSETSDSDDSFNIHSLGSTLDSYNSPALRAFRKKLEAPIVSRTVSVPTLPDSVKSREDLNPSKKTSPLKVPRGLNSLLGIKGQRISGSMENISRLSTAKPRNSVAECVSYRQDNKTAIKNKVLPDFFGRLKSNRASVTPPFANSGGVLSIPSPAGVLLETDVDSPLVNQSLPTSQRNSVIPFDQPLTSGEQPRQLSRWGSCELTAKSEILPSSLPQHNPSSAESNMRTSSRLSSGVLLTPRDVRASAEDLTSQQKVNRRRTPRMDIYEDALPFRKDLDVTKAAEVEVSPGDDDSKNSSDEDDEPIYYNLLLLRQQTLDRANCLMHSRADPATEKFDRQVRKLSMKYATPGAPPPLSLRKRSPELSGISDVPERSSRASDMVDTASPDVRKVAWKKRQSMAMALDSDSQGDPDELDVVMPPIGAAQDETLQMRKWVVKSILESEHAYIGILGILMQYMQTFRNLAVTPQAIISHADIDAIFHKIPELHKIHTLFIHELQPKVDNWSNEQCIAELFHILAIQEYQIAPSYLKNYQKAIATIHRCNQESPQFLDLTKEICCIGLVERPSLEELIHKPVVRFQRNTLVLHDLIKNTATAHSDYDLLQKTLKLTQDFLENLENPSEKNGPESHRYLAKHDLVVEMVDGVRKLRHIFLFNDIFVCARQKVSGKEKAVFEPKWFIPLNEFGFDDKNVAQDEKSLADSGKEVIASLKRKVGNLQNDLKVENTRAKVSGEAQHQWSFRGHSKNVEKIKKKLLEQKGQLILTSPCLLFNVYNRKVNKAYVLLMPSDYERTSWRSTIQGLVAKAQTPAPLTTAELHSTLNSLKLQKLSTMGALLVKEEFDLEEEYLSGSLSVTIRELHGLKQPADTFCCVEIDSYGHFFMQAKTNVFHKSDEPAWNEEFEIDLEGAQTMRILCYKLENKTKEMIGKCAFELSKDWLKNEVIQENISVGEEMSVSISLSMRSRAQTLKRTLSAAKEGLFGVRLRAVTRREGSRIPLIVTSCVEEIESRGLKDVGLYRVSGLSGEIQKLKKSFEKSSKGAAHLLKSADIHILTGLLKMYFRELPEALFTDALYPNFVTGMGLSDPEAKEKYMVQLMRSLPEPNYSTSIYILDHLIRVSRCVEQNKMTIHNIATVFGPTLLRPALKETVGQSREELFFAGAHDAMAQVAILLFVLNLKAKGVSFGSRL